MIFTEINLSPILNYEGKRLNISEDVDVTVSANDNFRLSKPIRFEGYALNLGNTIELHGNAKAEIIAECDRCLEEYEKNLSFEIDERYRKPGAEEDSNENPDILPLESSALDLNEIIYTNLFLNMPSKSLCDEACKGLCPECGHNLNISDCGCKTDSTDPRFDILDKLL